MKTTSFLILASLTFASTIQAERLARWHEVPSPSGDYKIAFSLSPDGQPIYRVNHHDKVIILPSGLGMTLADDVVWTRGFGEPTLTDRSAQHSI